MKKRIPILIGAACLAQILTMQPAQAQADSVESSVAVSYSDIDFNSEEGADVMLGRLRQAARRVCDSGLGRGLTRGGAPSASACATPCVTLSPPPAPPPSNEYAQSQAARRRSPNVSVESP